MAVSGRIGRRLALAIVLTALIPVLVAIWLAETTVRQTSARFFVPEVGAWLDQSLGLYQELARVTKASMRHQALAIARMPELSRALENGEPGELQGLLEQEFRRHPNLVELKLMDGEGATLAAADRQEPLDPERELQLQVMLPIPVQNDRGQVELLAAFATGKARFDEHAKMSEFVSTYRTIEQRRKMDESTYVYAFSALLGITVFAAMGVGAFLARGVNRRITELADAAQRVGKGDLSIRVPDSGADEVSDLARSFNKMLDEVEASRARIEYLQRISAWQEMARRLAHEIKNPLTPIQLAVQELHRRYAGQDPEFKKLVEITREIVEDEVGTLRRLVGEFSDFARMPRAQLKSDDLVEFLVQQDKLTRLGEMAEEEYTDARDSDLSISALIDSELSFVVEPELAPCMIDRQMLKRVLVNLITNADQALMGQAEKTDVQRDRAHSGKIVVRLHQVESSWAIDVEDNGPGVDSRVIDSMFDPYVTTKADGTGLGLAIVKKIVVEHGGSVAVHKSQLGGACVRIKVPILSSNAPAAAQDPTGELSLGMQRKVMRRAASTESKPIEYSEKT